MTASLSDIYPEKGADRDRWILEQRPPRNLVDPAIPYAFFVEEEYSSTGELVPIATIFLTNRECPWRCLMCDLWKNTLTESAPAGSIPAQIAYALERLPPARQIKLYNAGSFFDPRAIATQDHQKITEMVNIFERVIVECHPSLVGETCVQFSERISGKLEVAMGLETVHEDVLARLNKRMTLSQFAGAADKLRQHDIDLRVFILLNPPFMEEEKCNEWAARSLDFAFAHGATAATVIPTRAGNGAVDSLLRSGEFTLPHISVLEATVEYGLGLRKGRVFSDLWETAHIVGCSVCLHARIERLRQMNLLQQTLPTIHCDHCRDRE
jgi:archaeosine synthase beta-subunit